MANTYFKGKSAIVTGGASGIGRGIAKALIEAGARVWVADVDGAGARDAAGEFAAAGGDATAHELDVRDRDAVEALVDKAWDAFNGGLDMMVNNAGVAYIGDMLDMDDEAWDRTIDVNVMGVVHGVRAAYPRMVERGSGHIVNTASVAGLSPAPGLSIYGLSKHAVVGLSKSLAIEASAYGVGIHALCPGLIRTPLIDNAGYTGIDKRRTQDEAIAKLPMITPERVGRDTLRGVRKGKTIIVTPYAARAVVGTGHAVPPLERAVGRWMIDKIREFRGG